MDYKTLSKLEQQELSEVLGSFGLSAKEQAVYCSLLGRAETTMTPLARGLNYPPTTVQAILDRLSAKGLLRVTKKKSRHVYTANDPAVLKKILERQIKDIGGIIPILKKIQSNDEARGGIRIFYRERMADIFHEALTVRSGILYEIISARDLQDVLGEKFHFTKRRVERGIRLKSLRVEEREIKKYNKIIHERELREAKFLPSELNFRASVMIWDDTVAFFTTRKEGLAWVIESRATAEMMLQFFDLLWGISRRMETLAE
jgi:HTH-type transcriptional regulator, sugar sensing transcriptional regulator